MATSKPSLSVTLKLIESPFRLKSFRHFRIGRMKEIGKNAISQNLDFSHLTISERSMVVTFLMPSWMIRLLVTNMRPPNARHLNLIGPPPASLMTFSPSNIFVFFGSFIVISPLKCNCHIFAM